MNPFATYKSKDLSKDLHYKCIKVFGQTSLGQTGQKYIVQIIGKSVMLTLHVTYCVHTSMNVRKMKFISYIYIILGIISIS